MHRQGSSASWRHGVFAAAVLVVLLACSSTAVAARFPCARLPAPGTCGDGGPALDSGLARPTGVAVAKGGELLVADGAAGVLRRISADGRIDAVRTRGRLRFPAGVAVRADGRPVVADAARNQVLVIGPRGRMTSLAPGFAFDRPLDVDVTADGDVLVADLGADRVRRIGSDGRVDTVAAVRRPVDVAASPDGGFVVAGADGRVQRVAPGGETRRIGRFGRDPAVTVAADGAVLVAEAHRHRIVRVLPDGATEVVATGGCRTGAGLLGFVTALAIAADGSLVATDAGAGRVLAISGPLIRVVAGAGLAVPRDACRADRSRRVLAALSPPPRASADDIYSTPSCPGARDIPPFNVKLRSVRPARPRARQRFAVRGSTSMRARIFLRAKRRAVTRRTKAIRPRGSTFRLVFKRGLPRAGTYRLLLVADNARGERACARAKIKIRPRKVRRRR